MNELEIPHIRIEDKLCGCQYWKSGVNGKYSRTNTCSNYPNCKGKLFEKVIGEKLDRVYMKNLRKFVSIKEEAKK